MSSRAATLRIKRGTKILSEIPLGRARLVIGGGKGAQLRLKNAGLADECIALDLRETPFAFESLLPDPIKVNGFPLRQGVVKPGDSIEFLGITLELLDEQGRDVHRAPPAAIEEDVDPFMGKATAARVKMEDVERARARILKQREPAPVVPAAPRSAPTSRELPTARDIPAARAPAPVPAPPAQSKRREDLPIGSVGPGPASGDALRGTGFTRPPWLEAVGDGASDARLYLMGNGVVAGRQGELKVQHASVSKKHARFELRDGALHVVDLGSTNGTWINRTRVPQGTLGDGDTLHLGSVEFHVRIPDVPREEVTTLGQDQRSASRAAMLAPPQEPQRTRLSVLESELEAEADPPRDREPTFDPRAVTPAPGAEESRAELSAAPAEAPLLRGTEVDEAEQDERIRHRSRTARPAPKGRFEPQVYEPGSLFGEDEESLGLKTPEPAPAGIRSRAEALAKEASPRSRGESPFAPDGPTFDRSSSNRKDRTEPVRANTGSVAVKVPIRVESLPSASRRRSRGGAVFAAGSALAILLTGAGGVVAWPRVQARLATASTTSTTSSTTSSSTTGTRSMGATDPVAVAGGKGGDQQGSTRATVAKGDSRTTTSKGRATPTPDRRIASLDRTTDAAALGGRTRPDTRPTPVVDDGAFLDSLEAATPQPTPTPEVRLGREMFGSETIDLKGEGGRLDLARAGLEKDPSAKGIRVEREIGAKELGSIYLDQGVATVRRFHADGWDQAPSASDEVDAQGRAIGAAQIDSNRVNTLIRGRFDDVKKCLVGTSGFRGKARVVVQFTIMPDGRVDGLSVPSSDIKGAKFEGCVMKAVRTIKFPKPKDQSVIVQFPFVFFYQ